MKRIIKGLSVSFILRALATILTIIPVVYTVSHMATISEYKSTLVFIVLAVLAEILAIVFYKKFWNDFIYVAGAIFISIAFTLFLGGGILSIADYIAGINLFGDASQVPAIMTYSIILFCGAILAIVDCFISKDFSEISGNEIKIIVEKE